MKSVFSVSLCPALFSVCVCISNPSTLILHRLKVAKHISTAGKHFRQRDIENYWELSTSDCVVNLGVSFLATMAKREKKMGLSHINKMFFITFIHY